MHPTCACNFSSSPISIDCSTAHIPIAYTIELLVKCTEILKVKFIRWFAFTHSKQDAAAPHPSGAKVMVWLHVSFLLPFRGFYLSLKYPDVS